MKWYRVTTPFACGAVSVNASGYITRDWTAPIYRRFIGQPFDNLRRWSKVIEINGPYPW